MKIFWRFPCYLHILLYYRGLISQLSTMERLYHWSTINNIVFTPKILKTSCLPTFEMDQILEYFSGKTICEWTLPSVFSQYQQTIRQCNLISSTLAFLFRSRFLHMWNLDSRQLIQVIELPEKVKIVKSVDFVTNKMALNQHQVEKSRHNFSWNA